MRCIALATQYWGREVAVKVPPPDQLQADRLQRFMREARAASQINHPNVVAIYEIAESNGVHFIVMEYVAGKRGSVLIVGHSYTNRMILEHRFGTLD